MILLEEEEYLLLWSFSCDYRSSKDEKNPDKLAYYITEINPSTLQKCLDAGNKVNLRKGDTLEDFCINVHIKPLPDYIERPSYFPPNQEKTVQVIYTFSE